MGSMYPTLPSVSAMSDMSAAAPTSGLAPAFDADGRRRFSGNLLQKAAPDRRENDHMDMSEESRRSSEQDGLHHNVHQLAIHSPKVDPALSMRSPSQTSSVTEDPSWVENVRTIERIRQFIRDRLDHHDYVDDEHDVVKSEPRVDNDAQDLYPVLEAVRQARE